MRQGIASRAILDTPIAVLDFETTGLSPGMDRVVEISVMRIEPGQKPQFVLDTLVNPQRPMAATEIHGISDEDVADAPVFEDVAGDLVSALSGAVLAAYNVYFDMRFLDYEMHRAKVSSSPPHLCLMYLRPMLGLGQRCRLGTACVAHGIPYAESHVAAEDVEASARLLQLYLQEIRDREIRTFRDLAALRSYKFVQSFDRPPLAIEAAPTLPRRDRLLSRVARAAVSATPPQAESAESHRAANRGLGIYWDALKAAVADLVITDDEIEELRRTKDELALEEEQVRALHARAFASVISQVIDDQWLDDRERRKLRRLHQCLSLVGWAPGE